jgi:predicted dehydrogenase
MKFVRFGIIGAGQIVRYVSWVFREDPRIQTVAVADIDEKAAAHIAGEVGAEAVYLDYRRLLDRADVDAVYVATPPFLHRPMLLDALAAGKHVLCEKPFVLNSGEISEILAAERERSLKIGCCSCRFHEAATVRRARQMIASGDLGRIYRVRFDAVSQASPPGYTLPAWRNEASKNGGGIAYDWGVYDLDWITYLLSDRMVPRTLFGAMGNYFALNEEYPAVTPDVDGRLSAEIVCEEGLSVHWERRAAEHGPPYHLVQVRGERGGLDLSMIPGEQERLVYHAHRGGSPLQSEVQPETPPDWRNTLVYPIRDFTGALLEDRPPASPPERQAVVHALLDALSQSAATQSAVPVHLPEPENHP